MWPSLGRSDVRQRPPWADTETLTVTVATAIVAGRSKETLREEVIVVERFLQEVTSINEKTKNPGAYMDARFSNLPVLS